MDRSLDVEHVAEALPDLDDALADPRLRPIGLVAGFGTVLVGALLGIPAGENFLTSVVSGVLVFVGVPLFCIGLAAPEPSDEDSPFHLGVELSRSQRRVVAAGALLVVSAPMVVGALGPYFGFPVALWVAAAALATLGAVLMLTGFVAWTSRALSEPV